MVKQTGKKLADMLPLFYKMAWDVSRRGGYKYEPHDLAHEAWIYMRKMKIDTSQVALVCKIVKRRMYDFIRKEQGRSGSIRYELSHPIRNASRLMNRQGEAIEIGGNDKRFDEVDALDSFEYLINHGGLASRDKFILRLYFIDGLVMREIAKVIDKNFSESRVSQLIGSALKSIKANITNNTITV